MLSKKSKKVIGIDNSKEFVKIAKHENSNRNIIYELTDAENIDKIKDDFDIIFSALTLHLITPKKKLLDVLKKARKKLKDNGNFVVLIPHPCFINQNNREYNKFLFKKEFNYFNDSQEYLVKLNSRKGEIEFKSNFYNLETFSKLFD
ncbi:MAG: class I SAM-dependent methyltransferase [Candidatus Woesearchaeota archaeon]